MRRAEAALPGAPWRPALDPPRVLLVLLPSVAVALCGILGPADPWSLAALAACAGFFIWLTLRRRAYRAVPFVRICLGSAAAFGALCVPAALLGSRPVSTLSILAVLYLFAAFVAGLAPGSRLSQNPRAASARVAPVAFQSAGTAIVVVVAVMLATPLLQALQPAWGLLGNDSLDVFFGGHAISLGYSGAKMALVADSLLGGLLMVAAARALGARPVFAAAAAIAWIAADARFAPQFWNATPTFVVPLYALILTGRPAAPRAPAAALVVAAAGFLYWPLLVPLGVLTLGYALWRPDAASRARVASGFAAGSVAGILLAVLPGSLLRPPSTIVAGPLDGALRLVGGDGVWPWALLLPSLTSAAYGGSGQALLAATGFTGNALWVNATPGWALLAGLAGGWLTFRRRAPRAVSAAAAVVLAVTVLSLPSHLYSVPLPTPAELTFLAGSSGWLASSAALALVTVAAAAGAMTLTFLAERGRGAVATAGLLLVLLDAVPAPALFANLAASPAVGALRDAGAQPATGALFASLYDDDPRARLAREQSEFLFALAPPAARTFVRTLPEAERLSAADLGFPARDVAVVDYSAYDTYREAPFAGFFFVPNDLTGNAAAPDQVTEPEIDKTSVEGVYGSDFAYSPKR